MNMMNATTLPRFGGPGVFTCEAVAKPVPRADQFLVRVAACGICGHDLLNRQGAFPLTRLPAVIGHEISGVVEEVGQLVSRFRPGDRVALNQRMSCGVCFACREGRSNVCREGYGFYGEDLSGGYGEYVVASERNAIRLPDSIDMVTGAILSCAVGTGFHALGRARLKPGDSVVVTGASGGVGLHTVQLAHDMACRVIAITTSDRKVAEIRAAGADDVVVAPELDFHRDVRELTSGGATAVIEITGGPSFPSSIRSLRPGGRLVVVGNVQPGNVAFNLAVGILKEIELIGSSHATLDDLARVADLVSRGRIKPRIAEVLDVRDAARGHELMETKAIVGRVVLQNLHGQFTPPSMDD
jgi:D-arabinose 1-dehydrogenase-like Zn-dependent alcohol dehydrogenase